MCSARIRKPQMEVYKNKVDFETLFNVTFKEMETLFYVMAQQRQKRISGKNYSICSMKKIRILSMNVRELLQAFRWQSKIWEKMTQDKRAKLREQGIVIPTNLGQYIKTRKKDP